jgi:hypothetical protein
MAAEAVREAQKRKTAKAKYQRFATDPARYAAEVLGMHWWAKQAEIAQSVLEHRRTAVFAGHSVGKTHMLGGLVQWHFDCFDPSITLTTAPSWASIHDLLWGEIRSQRQPSAPGRLLDLRLDGGPMHYAKGHNAESGTGFQGRHEGRQLIVLDEGMGIPLYIWEATNAMMTSPHCRTLVTGNPTETSGPYYELLEDPSWNVVRISCLDHPNIAAELAGLPPPYPKAVGLVWVREMVDKHCVEVSEPDAECFEFPNASGEPVWYRPNDIFRSRVLGLFPKQASSSVWDEAWLEAARARVLEPDADRLPEIGADIARFGDDETVLYGGAKPAVTHREAYAKQATTETAGRIKRLADTLAGEHGCLPTQIPIKVDDTGLGGGVTDMLREDSYNVVPIIAGEQARDPSEYYNRRSELWFVGAGEGRKGQLDLTCLPPPVYRKLAAELRGVRYKIQSDKTLRVEGKDETKKRVGRSPDDADAFNLWLYPDTSLPAGLAAKASPTAPSRFAKAGAGLTGSRYGRGESRGWRR